MLSLCQTSQLPLPRQWSVCGRELQKQAPACYLWDVTKPPDRNDTNQTTRCLKQFLQVTDGVRGCVKTRLLGVGLCWTRRQSRWPILSGCAAETTNVASHAPNCRTYDVRVQQDNAPAHCARDTAVLAYCRRRRQNSLHLISGRQRVRTKIQWIMKFGAWCRIEFTRVQYATQISWNSASLKHGRALPRQSSTKPSTSGRLDCEHVWSQKDAISSTCCNKRSFQNHPKLTEENARLSRIKHTSRIFSKIK